MAWMARCEPPTGDAQKRASRKETIERGVVEIIDAGSAQQCHCHEHNHYYVPGAHNSIIKNCKGERIKLETMVPMMA